MGLMLCVPLPTVTPGVTSKHRHARRRTERPRHRPGGEHRWPGDRPGLWGRARRRWGHGGHPASGPGPGGLPRQAPHGRPRGCRRPRRPAVPWWRGRAHRPLMRTGATWPAPRVAGPAVTGSDGSPPAAPGHACARCGGPGQRLQWQRLPGPRRLRPHRPPRPITAPAQALSFPPTAGHEAGAVWGQARGLGTGDVGQETGTVSFTSTWLPDSNS